MAGEQSQGLAKESRTREVCSATAEPLTALPSFPPPLPACRVQLVSLCRFVGIQPFGTDAFLRSRLRRHLVEIKVGGVVTAVIRL